MNKNRKFNQNRVLAWALLMIPGIFLGCTLKPSKASKEESKELQPHALRLLNDREYRRHVQSALSVEPSSAFSRVIDDTGGSDRLVDFQIIDTLTTKYFIDQAHDVVEQMKKKGFGLDCEIEYLTDVERVNDPKAGSGLEDEADACAKRWLSTYQRRLYRRPLTEEETENSYAIYLSLAAKATERKEAFGSMIKSFLLNPEFLFMLHPSSLENEGFALASRLSFFLWAEGPDEILWEHALAGRLQNEEILDGEVSRMLDHEKAREFTKGFGRFYLSSHKLLDHKVDQEKFPFFGAEHKREWLSEADEFFHFFLKNPVKFKEMFTFDTGAIPFFQDPSAIKDSSRERKGVLGLRSFLTVTSGASETSPTKSALAILSQFLCQSITLPENVVTLENTLGEEVEHFRTAEEKLKKHREDPACASCHNVMDPIGLALEQYDAVGGFRAVYPNQAVINQVTAINDQTIDGLEGMGQWLSEHPSLHRCFTKNLYQYAMGRLATPDDQKAIDELTKSWNQGSIKELVKELIHHPSFSY